jgi:biopolymer transport protein ExbB/TolQ
MMVVVIEMMMMVVVVMMMMMMVVVMMMVMVVMMIILIMTIIYSKNIDLKITNKLRDLSSAYPALGNSRRLEKSVLPRLQTSQPQ